MNILVVGGTGLVGSHVVQGLVAKGEQVHILTRSAEKADVLPLGASGIIGDLHKPDTLRWAMIGIDRVCLISPLSPTETEDGLATVAAAKRAGVRHLVYLSVYHVERAPHIPHFKSKMEIQQALRHSGMAFTLIMANNFFQNDLLYRESILEEGVYPQPIGDIGMNRVDVRDIADAVVTTLTQTGHEFHCYPLIGVEVLIGQDMADIYSRSLGREIRYGGNDLEVWGEKARHTLPSWLVQDLKLMYKFFQKHGLRASEEDFALQAKVLGHLPRCFHTFVRETVTAWIPDGHPEYTKVG
ncbi:MAG TPA: NmrA family NAD(P)-binding protein [Nitrospiraceae bacterium]|nr:NmrA family NAD(P)-binding protein [Nitrospiraceae bacterium]